MSGVASERDSDAPQMSPPETAVVRELEKVAAPRRAAFLTNIGHEIRTPLNGVLGLSSLLRNTNLDATQRMYVDAIEQSSEALLGVLSNLLEFAHLEAGTVVLQPAPVEIEQIARSALATIQAAANVKAIELKLEMGEGADSTRTGDGARIVQVLAHLLNNAVKFTQGGSVTLSIQRFGRDEDGLIRMTVADTGIGMSQAQMDAVMSGIPHPVGADEVPRGAGLGLLISQRLVSQMGGRIVGSSELGRGSKFSVEIPMGPNLAIETPEPVSIHQPLRGLRVLVVEDDAMEGGFLSAILSRLGASTVSFSQGRYVAEAVATDRINLVVLDLHLPSLDAIRTTRAIRDLPGVLGRVPVIGVTAALGELDRWACLQSGMTDFLMKPLCEETLVEAVLRWARPYRGAAVCLSRPA